MLNHLIALIATIMISNSSHIFVQSTSEKQPSVGRILAIKGPMFGGKSGELVRYANMFQRCKVPVHIVAPDMSKREYFCRDGITALCPIVYLPRNDLKHHCMQFIVDFKKRIEDHRIQQSGHGEKSALVAPVLCIDEAQFFGELIDACCAMRRNGITVIVAGLALTFERQPFGEMHRLLDFADEIVEKKAVCAFCNSWNATLTHRTSKDKDVVVVGGENLYEPVCQLCYENVCNK